VIWTATGGTITPTGLFTVGSNTANWFVIATSTANAAVSGSSAGDVGGLRLGRYVMQTLGSFGTLLNQITCRALGTCSVFDDSPWSLQLSAPVDPSALTYRFTITYGASFTTMSDNVRIDLTPGRFEARGGTTTVGHNWEIKLLFG